MSLEFEWDEAKSQRNLLKHRVSFEEAVSVFTDPQALTIYDDAHSADEDRFTTIGLSVQTRVLLVVHADRSQRVRIISARRANARERKLYEEQL